MKKQAIAQNNFLSNWNYDLAMAIIDGMEARSIKGGYVLEGV
ncbi:hypothetical protein [Nostoc sp.]